MKKGSKHTEESKRKNRLAHLGKTYSEETKKELSEIKKEKYRNGYVNPMKGKHHTQETIENMRFDRLGEKNSNWKGGTSFIIRSSIYKRFREKILERDGYICPICGSTKNLFVHHILPRKEYPKLIFDKNNCLTLCNSCHTKYHHTGRLIFAGMFSNNEI